MRKKFNIAAIAALAIMALSCNTEGDKFQYGKEVIFMAGTEENPVVKLAVEDDPPASYSVVVSATGLVEKDVTVSLKVCDTVALNAYNKSHNSAYVVVDPSCVSVPSETVTIPAGSASSDAYAVTITDFSFMKNGVKYMIPVTISGASGTDMEIMESSRTIYIRLARTISFSSLSMNNTGMYSEYEFPDDKGVALTTYTYEVKCYPTNLKTDAEEQICRLCNFTNPEDPKKKPAGFGGQNMLRFNENGRPWRSLQIVTPSGGDYTTTTIFDINQWYMLSMVYDGSTYQLYINGEPDGTTLTSDEATYFQRIELGMSWTSYPSKQNFSGRICEMRVWNYARTKTQIQESLCGTDPSSEGLIAYWKFNQNSGTTFTDETGHGYDMDWTKSKREKTDGAGLTATPEAANYISWVKDDNNKCSE